jgi:hypothetical protein
MEILLYIIVWMFSGLLVIRYCINKKYPSYLLEKYLDTYGNEDILNKQPRAYLFAMLYMLLGAFIIFDFYIYYLSENNEKQED